MSLLAIADRAAPTIAPIPSPFASVAVHGEAGAVDAAWAELEACAPCSVYQTRGFVLPWAATLGVRHGLRPVYVLARDEAGRAAALLPLGARRRGGIRVAGWLGGRDSNLAMGLFRRPAAWSAADLRRLLRLAAREAGIDVFDLPNQPAAFAGEANPLAALPHAPSPSAAYATALPADAEALFAAKLSKDARKKLRKKEQKLFAMGEPRHLVASTAAERAAVVEAVLALKSERLRARGLASDFGAPAMRRFLEEAADGGAIELHALTLDGNIVAAYGGGVHGGQWSAMVNAFDGGDEIARTSPGDLLLMRVIAHCCARGIRRFDLGIGAARYKAALCDEPVALFDAIVAVTPRGRLHAVALQLRQAAKRRLKRDPRLHALALRLVRPIRFARAAR